MIGDPAVLERVMGDIRKHADGRGRITGFHCARIIRATTRCNRVARYIHLLVAHGYLVRDGGRYVKTYLVKAAGPDKPQPVKTPDVVVDSPMAVLDRIAKTSNALRAACIAFRDGPARATFDAVRSLEDPQRDRLIQEAELAIQYLHVFLNEMDVIRRSPVHFICNPKNTG